MRRALTSWLSDQPPGTTRRRAISVAAMIGAWVRIRFDLTVGVAKK